MSPATRLKIKLWVFTLQLLCYLFLLGILLRNPLADWRDVLALIFVCLFITVTTIVILSGWLGYASYIAGIKEARRGESHNDRP